MKEKPSKTAPPRDITQEQDLECFILSMPLELITVLAAEVRKRMRAAAG